ncbi:hypothetical protein AB0I60_06045 [Actinosynnema sp. NPDC050436]|uniref:hypothetical protein n=1 Tax=Actinosynnema sp. NPDC050436 TaxID=3155659 RepID=UPI0033D34CD9
MLSIGKAATATAVAVAALVPLVVSAPTAGAATLPNFRVGFQLVDEGGRSGQGVEQFTGTANFGSSSSQFAGDSNDFDPDGARINLNPAFGGGTLNPVDFRIGGQARDRGRDLGAVVFTPWAGQGGGTSDVMTDPDAFDPDQYRVIIETRPLPPGVVIGDFRLGLNAVDRREPEGRPVFTGWASGGGGQSAYAFDANAFDPDGFRFILEVV